MTNIQFLEMLELAENCHDFNHLVPIVFPGASKLHLDQPFLDQNDSEVPSLPPRLTDPESEVPYKNLPSVN